MYNLSGTSKYIHITEHVVGGASTSDTDVGIYIDGLGREYASVNWTASPSIVAYTYYDDRGRIRKKSTPYYYGDTGYYTEYTYDNLSRVTDIKTPDNKHITTSYHGQYKTVTDQNNHTTIYAFDTFGRPGGVMDHEGTLTIYSYDTMGNVVSVIAADGETEENTSTMTYNSVGLKRSMTDPDMGYWTYAYDKNGNLTSQTDAKSQTITFQYDELNRLEEKIYPDRTVTYTYDDPTVSFSEGALTEVLDPLGDDKYDTVLAFDLMQRPTLSEKSIGTNSVTMAQSYDSAGRVYETTYFPGGAQQRIFRYSYDGLGNMTDLYDVTAGKNLVEYSDFTAVGQYKKAVFPKSGTTDVISDYTYDPVTKRLSTLLTRKFVNGSPSLTYQNLEYDAYDGKGAITTLVDNYYGITHTYTRDSLDRLVSAVGTGTGAYSRSYEYDIIGNITYKSDVGSYAYNYGNRPHAVNSAGGMTFTYDSNGNMTQKPAGSDTLNITYNYDNMPTLVKKNSSNYVTFEYDGNGQRVKKSVVGGSTTLYFGDAYEVRGSVDIMHIFDAYGTRIVSIRTDGIGSPEQCYHGDHLGSASVITDINGNMKERIDYNPFGTNRQYQDNDGSFPNTNYTFTDQENDDDLGLMNYNARLYDPLLGRFISPDIFVPDPYNLQSYNRYSYVLNDPLTYTDPTGYFEAVYPDGFPEHEAFYRYLEGLAKIFDNEVEFYEMMEAVRNASGVGGGGSKESKKAEPTESLEDIVKEFSNDKRFKWDKSNNGCNARAYLMYKKLVDYGHDTQFIIAEDPPYNGWYYHIAPIVDELNVIDPKFNQTGIMTINDWRKALEMEDTHRHQIQPTNPYVPDTNSPGEWEFIDGGIMNYSDLEDFSWQYIDKYAR